MARIDSWDGFRCDTCGKPIVDGDAVYSIATNVDAKTARHYRCYVPIEKALDNLRQSLNNVERDLDRIKRSFK